MIALAAVPLYALARTVLVPLAQRHASEAPPRGRPLSLRVQLGYTVFAVATAALVPATVFGMAQLDAAATADAHARAEKTGGAAGRDGRRARRGRGHAPVSRARRWPGASASSCARRRARSFPKTPPKRSPGSRTSSVRSAGSSRGGTLRVYYAPRPISPVAAHVGDAGAAAHRARGRRRRSARAVARDARGVADQIARVADGEEPRRSAPSPRPRCAAWRMAVNRLLERIPRLTVESFLAVERAEEARRLKSQFLANMSHDLRSPLNSILGFSELLLRGLEGEISAGQRVVLAAMHATGLNLLRLLTEILDTAKVESGKMELHRQSSPPAEVLTPGAAGGAPRPRGEHVADKLTIELQPGMRPHLRRPAAHDAGDHAPPQLRARRRRRRPRDAPRRRGRRGRQPRLLVIDLAHAGILAGNDRAHVFDSFRRVAGGKGGLNLALPLAKRIFELHGGNIDLADRQAAATRCARASAPSSPSVSAAKRRPPPAACRAFPSVVQSISEPS